MNSDPEVVRDGHIIVRLVRCVRGRMRFRMSCEPRFDYGRASHTVEVTGEGAVFESGGVRLVLHAGVPLEQVDQDVVASFELAEGDVVGFVLESAGEQVMTAGWDEKRRAFVQHYETNVLDASVLLAPVVGFISSRDPRWLSTLDAIDEELVTDSLVYRYDPAASPDGLQGSEGTFSICTMWYVDAMARAGRVEEARLAFEKMLTYANPVGLFSEEIAVNGEQIGNFPQAFTHLALINAAITLDAQLNVAQGPGHESEDIVSALASHHRAPS